MQLLIIGLTWLSCSVLFAGACIHAARGRMTGPVPVDGEPLNPRETRQWDVLVLMHDSKAATRAAAQRAAAQTRKARR